jgi:hypothetical protein
MRVRDHVGERFGRGQQYLELVPVRGAGVLQTGPNALPQHGDALGARLQPDGSLAEDEEGVCQLVGQAAV